MLLTDDTPTLRDVVHLYGNDLWDAARPYPIWDESEREELQNKIYDHFEFRKIAQDTPALFVAYLNRRMREIMPVINPIFAALADEKLDIMATYSTEDTNISLSESNSTARQIFSATPQAQLSGAKDYATNLTDNTGKGTDQGKSTSTHKGTQGQAAEVLTKWLTGVNNALYIVFNGLEPLFNQLYDDEGF